MLNNSNRDKSPSQEWKQEEGFFSYHPVGTWYSRESG
jgi:hypothetical protein